MGKSLGPLESCQHRQIEQLAQLGQGIHGDGEVAIGSLVNSIGGTQVSMGSTSAGALGKLAAVVEMGGEDLELKIEQRFQERGLHVPALARNSAAHEARK